MWLPVWLIATVADPAGYIVGDNEKGESKEEKDSATSKAAQVWRRRRRRRRMRKRTGSGCWLRWMIGWRSTSSTASPSTFGESASSSLLPCFLASDALTSGGG